VIDGGDLECGAELRRLADELWTARCERRLLNVDELVGRRGRDWSMADAYLVQAMLMQRRWDRGERHVGWKLGYTSLAMRQQMGIGEPNFGLLTDAMMVGDGDAVPATVMQPRVEPEIAVRLGVDVDASASIAEIAASVDTASACLEVVDSVWSGYRFRIEHNTADGSSAAHVVLGGAIAANDLSTVTVRLRHNGDEVAIATGAAASGDPLVGIAWLAGQLALTGRRLRAGEIIITGGLTAAVPLDEGDCVEAIFDGDVVVSCRRRGGAAEWG
jgi:2-keto-4-pentenoate hydratase